MATLQRRGGGQLMNLKKNENSFFLNIVVNLLNDRYKFKLYLRHFELHISIQNPQTTQTKMLSRLSGLPSEIQDIIMKLVHQLEEQDKQLNAVAHLDGLLDDVVLCLGVHNNITVPVLHQMLDVWDVSGPV
jgi:hypothetical protein